MRVEREKERYFVGYVCLCAGGYKKGPGGVMPRGSGTNPDILTVSDISLADLWEIIKAYRQALQQRSASIHLYPTICVHLLA